MEHLADLDGHLERVWSLSWSPNGKLLASCSGDKTVRIWGQDAGARWVCHAVLEDAHDRTIRSVSWAPDAQRLATASFDGTCVVWSHNNGEFEQIATMQGHENEVKSVAWDPAGKLLATCSRDKSVWVWENVGDDDDYECVAVLHGHSQDVKMVLWHPTKEVLVSASYDDSLRVWEADEDDWTCNQTLESHASTVWALAFDKTGDRMASVSDDKTLRIWRDDGSKGSVGCCYKEEQVVKGSHSRAIYHLDWHTSAELIATAAGDDSIRVFTDKGSGAEGQSGWKMVAGVEKAHAGDVNCVKWQPESKEHILASAGDDGLIKLWRFSQ